MSRETLICMLLTALAFCYTDLLLPIEDLKDGPDRTLYLQVVNLIKDVELPTQPITVEAALKRQFDNGTVQMQVEVTTADGTMYRGVYNQVFAGLGVLLKVEWTQVSHFTLPTQQTHEDGDENERQQMVANQSIANSSQDGEVEADNTTLDYNNSINDDPDDKQMEQKDGANETSTGTEVNDTVQTNGNNSTDNDTTMPPTQEENNPNTTENQTQTETKTQAEKTSSNSTTTDNTNSIDTNTNATNITNTSNTNPPVPGIPALPQSILDKQANNKQLGLLEVLQNKPVFDTYSYYSRINRSKGTLEIISVYLEENPSMKAYYIYYFFTGNTVVYESISFVLPSSPRPIYFTFSQITQS